MKSGYVGRFAPSPTGDMHLGIARTSLAAWLDARAQNGHLVLRIEDIDHGREVAGSRQSLIHDLEWLGLDWDEGPGREGSAAPYLQSECSQFYEEAIDRLRAMGRVFDCSCSRRDIRAASAPHADDDKPAKYPGTCRTRGAPLPERNTALRFATIPGDVVHHTDRNGTSIDEDVVQTVGDFVLRRTDGLWAYQLAVTVDDLRQGVTCVVRGDDLLDSTGRQLLLRRLLKPSAPPLETLHVPLMHDAEGRRLAKRHGSTTVKSLREQGHTAEDIVGQLAFGLKLRPNDQPVAAVDLIDAWKRA